MTKISKDLRQRVIERANACCEYCQTQRRVVIDMNIDHIVPLAASGETEFDNLCYSCPHCNRYKSDEQTVVDPDTGITTRLFNPRIHRWSDHFQWSDDNTQLIGLTPTGKATIMQLRMNASDVVEARTIWVQVGWHPPKLDN
jgi:hypothetical protein